MLTSASTYDRLSRVTSASVSGETTVSSSVHYDTLGRVDSSAATDVAGPSSVSTTFDKSSLPVSVTWSALDTSATVTNAYAKTDQWRSTTGFGHTWKYSWTDGGGLASIFSTFASRYYAYDPTGRLSSVRLGCPHDLAVSTDIGRIDVAYDAFDRISTLAGRGVGTLAATDTYAYDPAGRLASWTRAGAAASAGAWTYDSDGNITTATRGGVTTAFGYDDGERLTTATVGALTSVYTSDEFGRRTSVTASGETTTFAWNASGALARVASSDATATYEYGAGGMRVRKTVESPASFLTTEYFYTGSQLTAERDSDGTLYRYLYGPGGAPLEVRVTTGTVTASYAVHTDALGSVVALSDESGAPVATYAYDPWGAPIATTLLTASALDRAVALRQPFRYRGYTLDAETGLYYLPARYYDPQACRFLSPDPAAPSAGNPASLNPYVYCPDDPIGASDPSGAIMDVDGDGKVSSIDCLELAVRNAKGKTAKDKARRRANDAWKAFKAQQAALAAARAAALAAAKAAARDRAARMAMAHARLGASLAMKAAAEEAAADLAGRRSLVLRSEPDGPALAFEALGATMDLLTSVSGPAAPAFIVVGLIVDVFSIAYTGFQVSQGKATGTDFAWSIACIVPGVSAATFLGDIGVMAAEHGGVDTGFYADTSYL